MPEDIEIAVVGAHPIADALRVVPLVEHLFHRILPSIEPEAGRALVRLAAGMGLDLQFHFLIMQEPGGAVSADVSLPVAQPEDNRSQHRAAPGQQPFDSPYLHCLPIHESIRAVDGAGQQRGGEAPQADDEKD